MLPERARYILDNRLLGGSLKYSFLGKQGASREDFVFEDGLTEEEVKFVMSVWNTMNGNTSFVDALYRIAKGQT